MNRKEFKLMCESFNKFLLTESLKRVKPSISQHTKKLWEDLNLEYMTSTSASEPFVTYDYFDSFSDEEMTNDPEGYQIPFDEIINFINSSGKTYARNVSHGDVVLSNSDLLSDNGVSEHDLAKSIVKKGKFTGKSGTEYTYGEIKYQVEDYDEKLETKIVDIFTWSDAGVSSEYALFPNTDSKFKYKLESGEDWD